MKKNAFTLIELLAVIVILAIIALIAVPIILNIIEDAKKSSKEESIKMYAKIVEKAATNYFLNHPKEKTVTIDKLDKLINYNGDRVICKTTKIYPNGKIYLKDCTVDGEEIEYTYGEKQRNPNITVDLTQGLTPVIYDGDNWVVTDKNDNDWYDYDEQQWANAVVLRNDVQKQKGDTVTVEGENPEVLMMFVYIPRYEYKIDGQYGKHPDGTDGTAELPGEIKVNFIKNNKITPTSGYHIHPAFIFGEQQTNGFWIGKFELSRTESVESSSVLRVLPNVESSQVYWLSHTFIEIYGVSNDSTFGLSNIDTHMIKNSEWGAVAYLSQSKYGKYGNIGYEGVQKEVYINNSYGTNGSGKLITGRSGGNIPGNTKQKDTYPTQTTSTAQYSLSGYYTYDGYLLNYNTNVKSETRDIKKGTGASTTGNIYGVYDMNGGRSEYVMGAYGDSEGIYSGYNRYNHSHFNGRLTNDSQIVSNYVDLPDSKYYDKYLTYDVETACNGVCYGQALSETSGWYGDGASMINNNNPWIIRGCNWNSDISSGIFRYYGSNGENFGEATRIVAIKK